MVWPWGSVAALHLSDADTVIAAQALTMRLRVHVTASDLAAEGTVCDLVERVFDRVLTSGGENRA